MRSKKKMTAIGLACLLTVSAPFGSMAQEKPESMDQETWERLQDNVLEYDEIEGLIAEYNATVQANQLELNEFKRKYGKDFGS